MSTTSTRTGRPKSLHYAATATEMKEYQSSITVNSPTSQFVTDLDSVEKKDI